MWRDTWCMKRWTTDYMYALGFSYGGVKAERDTCLRQVSGWCILRLVSSYMRVFYGVWSSCMWKMPGPYMHIKKNGPVHPECDCFLRSKPCFLHIDAEHIHSVFVLTLHLREVHALWSQATIRRFEELVMHDVSVCVTYAYRTVYFYRRQPAHPVSVPFRHPREVL